MAEGALIDRLDGAIDTILARRDATAALAEPELAALAVLAAALKHLPSPVFRARLRAHLERRTIMSSALATTDIREGFTTITPYLRVREAGLVNFLAHVFGAEETHRTPQSAGGTRREVRIGDSMLIIGEGGPEGGTFGPTAFHVYVIDVDAAFARALAAGAESLGEPEDRPYGERAGFVKDPFGNHWYIAAHLGPSYVPEGLRTVTPFLHPSGVPAFIEFMKRAFGAVEELRHESPDGIVVHARLRIGNAAIEMGDARGAVQPMPGGFYLYVGDADVLYEQAVAAGAKALSPPADQRNGDRVAGVEDSMGNEWFIVRPAS
jgi:PhnB protein